MSRHYLNIEFRKQIVIKNDILSDDVLCVLFKMSNCQFVDHPVFISQAGPGTSVTTFLKDDLCEIFANLKENEILYFYLNDSSIFWKFGNFTCVRVASSKNTVHDIALTNEHIKNTVELNAEIEDRDP